MAMSMEHIDKYMLDYQLISAGKLTFQEALVWQW